MESTQSEHSASEQAIVSQNGSRHLKKISLILIILGVTSYAFFAPKSQVTLGEAIVNTLDGVRNSKIKSVEFSSSLNADINLKDFDKKSQINELSGAFPPGLDGMNISMSFDGVFDGTGENGLEAYGKLNLNMKINASSDSPITDMIGKDPLVIELEYYAFPDSIYFKINKVPSVVEGFATIQGIELSGYLNRWFVFNETEISLFKKGFSKGFSDAAKKDNINFEGKNPFSFDLSDESYSKLRLAILKYLDQSGVIVISDRKKETTTDGQKVTALYIKFDKEKYLPALKNFSADLKEIFPELLMNMNLDEMEGYIEESRSPILTASDINMKIFVGADGYFHGEAGSITVPATDDIPGISEDIYISLKNYNKSFKLEKPRDAEAFIEAFMEMQSLEQE